MKYLKPYRIFENNLGEDITTLNDIAEEVRDDGYVVRINKISNYSSDISIYFLKMKDIPNPTTNDIITFPFIDIKDSISHMINLMEADGYKYNLYHLTLTNNNGTSWNPFGINDKDLNHHCYQIYFSKKI